MDYNLDSAKNWYHSFAGFKDLFLTLIIFQKMDTKFEKKGPTVQVSFELQTVYKTPDRYIDFLFRLLFIKQ